MHKEVVLIARNNANKLGNNKKESILQS